MLYIINENTFNGYSVYNLDSLHIIAILFGILVIISKNPIVSVLFLIGLFLAISGYLILTGLNFIGLAYLLVYIGAVSILFLFILMLINVRISELLIDSINSIPLAILLGSFFNYFVNNVLPYTVMINSLFFNFTLKKKLTNVTSVSWDGYLAETSHITSIGNILYGNYSIWLILTSVILLLAMVGCILITLKEKSVNANKEVFINNEVTILQSSFGFYRLFRVFFFKLKIVGDVVFSRAYLNDLTRKIFTLKSLYIIISSLVIGSIVRYFAIKYGIGTPLHDHPYLFTSATGITSFLSLISKANIEMLFTMFEDKKLTMGVSEPGVIPRIPDTKTTLKMNSHSEGLASRAPSNTRLPDNRSDDIPALSLDFSKLDNLLNELKSNMHNFNQQRLEYYKKEIDIQIEILQGLGTKANEEHVPTYTNLLKRFIALNGYKGISDIQPEIQKIVEVVGRDKGSPHSDLLASNPEKYWKDKVKYVNRIRESTNTQCKIIKDYLKTNTVLSPEEKQPFYTEINKVKKNAAVVADADNSVLKKQIENSVILTELNKKLTK